MKSILMLLGAIGAHACVRDLSPRSLRHRHVKRAAHDTTQAALDANEKILVESFDTTSIDTWSYYYSSCAMCTDETQLTNTI
jgi:N-acetylated-alpha-linked acidic dipeptidase